VARDITHQTRLEAEQAALRERLGQSEKLASLGQFVAGIAHEMNNPLQGVLGHLELMIETSADARPLRRDLRRIYHEADRAAKIVRNLLVFAGSRRMTRRRLRINRVVSRALSSRTASLKRGGIENRARAARGPAGVFRRSAADAPGVSQHHHQRRARHSRRRPAGAHRAAVVARRGTAAGGDHGCATQVQASPRRSCRASSTRSSRPRKVGQGPDSSAITYGIVQEHGGTISAANLREGGAEITIALPLSEEGPPSRSHWTSVHGRCLIECAKEQWTKAS
jgi:signal transduction histidine kinase